LGAEMKKDMAIQSFSCSKFEKKSQKHVATNVVWVYDMFFKKNLVFYTFYKCDRTLGRVCLFLGFFLRKPHIFFYILSPF
jgi:hypothetical protein